ncbi:RagB/SusD family nutrient uptake outer membrane protein [Butyricimonas synergistica]|uniref:RagB/SusD family nutrient uptake outer membrane protein n=1 Tax=Butyricimonas synergistica TaxID=544644 RepID=UPI0022E2046D|nr:RagB/SusD family nutrient uptake outer membrane protein [Butyricimonas synergistica]
MKRYIAIGCLCLTMLFAACDNYLDIVPKGQSVLNSTDDYLGLLEEVSPSYDVGDFWYMADEVCNFNMPTLEAYQYPLSAIGFFWDETKNRADYMETDELYDACYKRIMRYNVVISNIDDSEGNAEDKVTGKAQAKIMRAYNYFFLVNKFAKFYDKNTAATDNGIIIHEELNLEAKSKQYTVAQVYEVIERDIMEALPDLPERAKNAFLPDRYFGYALKAKVHLFKREIDEALAAGLEALKSDYHKLWDMPALYTKLMAENPLLGMMPTMWSSAVYRTEDDPENLLYQFGLTQFDPSPSYVRKPIIDLYDKTSDLRYLMCISYAMPARPTAEVGAMPMMCSNVKWNCGGIRLSEVYLMVAECYARKDDKTNALFYLDELRKMRFLPAGYKASEAADAKEAFRLIRDERKRELLLTSNGFFDMRRFCAEFNETLTKEYVMKNATTGETTIKTYTLKPNSPLLIWPFPKNAMETSDLIQNTTL